MAFARSQLDDVHSVEKEIDVPSSAVAVYRVSAGPPLDCPSGCFYGGGWVLQSGAKLGWLLVDSVPASKDPAGYRFYDFDSRDGYLFTDAALDDFRSHYVFSQFRWMLAGDVDTPLATLRRLASDLPTDGWPALAERILDFAVLREDRATVEIVANLGPSEYNFQHAMSRARALLEDWSPPGEPAP